MAAKTQAEAITKAKNVSASAAPSAGGAAPAADRTPAPPKKAPAPVDPQEAQRRRESGIYNQKPCTYFCRLVPRVGGCSMLPVHVMADVGDVAVRGLRGMLRGRCWLCSCQGGR